MITFIKKIFRFCLLAIEVATDWFLIVIGLVISAKALFAVDLPTVKYILTAIGITLSGCGIWYRYKRLRSRK